MSALRQQDFEWTDDVEYGAELLQARDGMLAVDLIDASIGLPAWRTPQRRQIIRDQCGNSAEIPDAWIDLLRRAKVELRRIIASGHHAPPACCG